MQSKSPRGEASGEPWLRAVNVSAVPAPRDMNPAQSSPISFAGFVGTKFIPEHVEQKSFSGRTHYQSMLKHILRPETVDSLFHSGSQQVRTRLKAIPFWPYLDNVRLGDVTVHHVRDLTSAALAQGYSTQTVKHIRNVLGAIISHAKRERLFTGENPVIGVELPPICRKRAYKLTLVQAKAMLRMMQYPEREIALITITTGMSISEICGLQWKHVNLTKSSVDCEGARIPPGSILVKQHWNPEGIVNLSPNRIRLVEVPEPLARPLLTLKQEPASADPGCFVFTTTLGKPMRPDSVRMLRLKQIGRKLEMPWISWQVLARAHVTLLSEFKLQLSRDLVLSLR